MLYFGARRRRAVELRIWVLDALSAGFTDPFSYVQGDVFKEKSAASSEDSEDDHAFVFSSLGGQGPPAKVKRGQTVFING